MNSPPSPDSPDFMKMLSGLILPHEWEPVSPSDPGYCYLCLFDEEVAQRAARRLGAYPLWGDVRNFGGFKLGCFHAYRMNGVVHISDQGLGTEAQHLPIKLDEIVGAVGPQEGYLQLIFAFLFTLFTPFGLFQSGTILLNACFLQSTESPAPLRKVTSGGFRRNLRQAIFLLALANITFADAALTFRLDRIASKFISKPSDDDLAELGKFHHKFVLNRSLPAKAKLCLPDNALRLELLDLDVQDDVFDEYVQKMCPGMKEGWRLAAENELLNDPTFSYEIYFDVAVDYADEKAKRAIGFAGKAANLAVQTVEGLGSDLLLNAKVASVKLKEGANIVTEDILVETEEIAKVVRKGYQTALKTAVKAADKATEAPEKVLDETIATIDAVVSLTPKPSDIVASVGAAGKLAREKLPKTSDVVDVAYGAVEQVATDVMSGTGAVYLQFKDLTSDYFDKLKRNESVFDILDWSRGAASNAFRNVTTILNTTLNSAPNIAHTTGKTAGSLPSGLLHGLGVNREENSIISSFKHLLFTSPETAEEKRLRREHELERVKLRDKTTPYLSQVMQMIFFRPPWEYMIQEKLLFWVVVLIFMVMTYLPNLNRRN